MNDARLLTQPPSVKEQAGRLLQIGDLLDQLESKQTKLCLCLVRKDVRNQTDVSSIGISIRDFQLSDNVAVAIDDAVKEILRVLKASLQSAAKRESEAMKAILSS